MSFFISQTSGDSDWGALRDMALWRRMEHAVTSQLTPKDWQLSIPQQMHQPQTQVGDVGNERERHDGLTR